MRDCDVAVIGGGPIGLVYATWVRRFRPQTHVVVLERRQRPGHKVGESTLSTTIRCFNAMGLNHAVLRRLFGNKAGLRWFHTEEDSQELNGHFDIIDIEETYQVERRVLETAMQYLATSREGVELLTGTRVLIRESKLDGPEKQLMCEDENGDRFILRAKLICDASGPASVIPRHLGLYRKEPERYDSFNYNSYFAYFRPKEDVPIDFWSYPATRHICFKEGWLWFISLITWENNPYEKVDEMIRYLIDFPGEEDEDYPTREALCEQFGLTTEPIMSIGFTLRDDRDIGGMPIQERFDYWVNKYPAIRWVLDHFELVEGPYEGKQRAHFAFMNMLHDVEQIAGDGWCVIGDAAMFINPFFSLGLNYGTGTAYMAAKDTVAGLDANDVSQQAFANYQQYATELFRVKLLETDMYYRSFNHLRSYERALALVIAWGITDVLPRGTYSDSDPYVFDPLNPEWVDVIERLAAIQREGEREHRPPAEIADSVTEVVNAFIEHLNQTRQLYSIPLGNYTRFYGNDWQRSEMPRYEKGRGDYEAIPCPQCSLFFDDSVRRCPYCGEPQADYNIRQEERSRQD
ncbi:MAG: tryptophan 7-halogenase [Anaerolineae bacterium]